MRFWQIIADKWWCGKNIAGDAKVDARIFPAFSRISATAA
jgi:hypothetical protein